MAMIKLARIRGVLGGMVAAVPDRSILGTRENLARSTRKGYGISHECSGSAGKSIFSRLP
jgi:hypothetical protein